ncbi:GNAT family N-acetyltransferase [Anaerotignum sp.]|nr:GNAT family N-acetyltransferase [Anaerotignum sp.]MBQ7759380.1 GNAT family N-acetyltransferase [Anaerotignum sp.]
MIRLATKNDLDEVEKIFHEILDKEAETVSYSNWIKGKYPTKAHAKKALDEGTLYVGEDENGRLFGCANLNHIQLDEYVKIPWEYEAEGEEVFVIHMLCIRPDCAGQGRGKEFIAYSEELARGKGCKVVRIDTYEGNIPAANLYQSLGYRLAGKTLLFFQQVIWENLICLEKKL